MQIAPILDSPVVGSFGLVAATTALIAFHIGLLTLVGRERRSPYVIDLAFPVFLLCLLVAALSIAAPVAPWRAGALLITVATWTLVAAVLISIVQVYRIAVRFLYFVDTIKINHIFGIRQIRRRRITRSRKRSYTHNPLSFPEDLRREIVQVVTKYSDETARTQTDELSSLAIAVAHLGQSNTLLAELAIAFLKKDFTVQYMSASRHPIELIGFLHSLAERSGDSWPKLAPRIVALDAYSPHFGFIDSIHRVKDLEFDELGVTVLKSKRSYAGVHTAASKAFHTIKDRVGKEPYREPTLVIYEGSYALADLESAEQYRVFVRHVLPSEKMWGGMFTVFVECSQPESDWRLLYGYANLTIDMRSSTTDPSVSVRQ